MSRRARVALITLIAAAWASSIAVSASAATTVVNGVITLDDALILSEDAVAVVTLVDQTATDAGAIVGQQRIDHVTSLPVAFQVLYDDAAIDATHSYALFGAIVDGDAASLCRPAGEDLYA